MSNYILFNGKFILSDDVVRIINPLCNKEAIFFSIDKDHFIEPVNSYQAFVQLYNQLLHGEKIINPFIYKHQTILSIFKSELSGVTKGRIVDVDMFTLMLHQVNVEVPLELRLRYKQEINEDCLSRLYQYGYSSAQTQVLGGSVVTQKNYTIDFFLKGYAALEECLANNDMVMNKEAMWEYFKDLLSEYAVWKKNYITGPRFAEVLVKQITPMYAKAGQKQEQELANVSSHMKLAPYP